MVLDQAWQLWEQEDMANTTRTVPKGPRQIPQGYDD
jgi:hypothetical protein